MSTTPFEIGFLWGFRYKNCNLLARDSRASANMDRISLNRVTKLYRQRPALFGWIGRERSTDTLAVDQVTLTARPGEVLALLGPNGSGKSTTLKLIATMLLPDEGNVLVCGADTRTEPQRVRKAVGFAVASERSFFPRLTARENLDFFAALEELPRPHRGEQIQLVLDETGLSSAADTVVMKYSSGMYQKLGIARALLKNPSVLLLDEPTRSLDPGAAQRLWELIRTAAKNNDVTVLMASHSFDEAIAVGDSVAVLQQGRLIAHRQLTSNVVAGDLRRWYFSAVGEITTPASLARVVG